MPLMRFVLFAVVLPLQFPLLNLSTWNRNDLRRQALETLERRFFFLWDWMFHYENSNSKPQRCKSLIANYCGVGARIAHAGNTKSRTKEARLMR